MAAKTKENKDIYRWVKSTIVTCDDPQQLIVADRLAELFLAKLRRERHPVEQIVRKNLYTAFIVRLQELL